MKVEMLIKGRNAKMMKILICKVAGSSRSLQPLAFLPRLSPRHAEVDIFSRTITYVFLTISSFHLFKDQRETGPPLQHERTFAGVVGWVGSKT